MVMEYILLLCLCQFLPTVRSINPKFFPCDNDVDAIHVDCSRRTLTQIPLINSISVTSMNLSHNKIQLVGRVAFSGVPNLQILDMAWNCLPGDLRDKVAPLCQMAIHNDSLWSLHELHTLRLSGNSLSSLPRLPRNLILLDLEFNRLVNIIQPLGTPWLRQLFLSKNCYYANPCYQSFHIHESVFKELSKLQTLTLGYNNMTSVPVGLPPTLHILDLRENKIPKVASLAFANLTELRDLILEWNCQRCDHAAQPCFPCPMNASLYLYPDSLFARNSSLTYLSLRGNSLRTFPEGLFRPLRQLKRLDISDNLLAYAMRNGSFFKELSGLTWLSLIYNYEPLKTFPDLVLSPDLGQITDLKYLLLSGNFFRNVSRRSLDTLAKLRNLEVLELRMNFIVSCNLSALGQLPALKKVDLSQNLLNFLPKCSAKSSIFQFPQRIQNQHSYTRVDNQNLPQSIQNQHSYTRVDGQNLPQGIQNQHRYARMDDQNLPLIQMDQTELWDPPSPTVSTTKTAPDMDEILNDDISQIPAMWNFKNYYCKNNNFDLSQNDITTLKGSIFEGMEKIVCLDLSYNYMSQALNGHQFLDLDNLVYLNMAHNRIDFYYNEAFQELNATLKALDLSNNEFHFLMRGMGHRFEFIHNLSNLEVLSLADNGIGMRIDQRLKSASIKFLYFAGNNLDIMWDSGGHDYFHFFQDLTKLFYLDISRNQLRSFSPEAFCNLPQSLRALQVSENSLNYFPWENITALRQLRHLNISGNHLSSLPNQVIDFQINFTLLDLSHNRISQLPATFFSKAQGLRHLYLSYNKLKLLDQQNLPAPLKFGSALQTLTLHGNPFACFCDTSWFADYLRNSTVAIPHLTTYVNCEFPESLQGESVLTVDHRSCQDIFGNLAFLSTTFLVVVLTVLPLLRHLYGWDLWYCFQVMWAGHKGYSQLPGSDIHNHYDAFVVFDTGNKAVRDWVYNELTVHLENTGRRRFHLCLEERDWVPGLSCIENLHNAVYSSVKTVFVLTSGGSGSGSGSSVNGIIRQVFFMVQQRLLDEKEDVAVLVLLDEVFPKMKYLQLRKRLCRKSVLSWPRNPRAQPLFWTNMRAALSSDNLRSYDSNMSESFL